MVQRYELELYHSNGGEMAPCDEGGYVEYEDYAELEAKYQMIVGHFIKAKQYQDSCEPELMNSAIWQAYQGWKK